MFRTSQEKKGEKLEANGHPKAGQKLENKGVRNEKRGEHLEKKGSHEQKQGQEHAESCSHPRQPPWAKGEISTSGTGYAT